MLKKISILTSNKSQNFEAIKEYFKSKKVEIYETTNVLEAADSDICVVDEFDGHLSKEILECTNFIKVHYSLLPAFDTQNPIEDAFNSGVKISGVTINYINEDFSNGKIIAQYPVFIDYMTTLQEFKDEIYKVSQKLAPFVLESILDDKVFCFDMLLKPQSGCSGCGGCKK